MTEQRIRACPKCDIYPEVHKDEDADPMARYFIKCENPLCRWHNRGKGPTKKIAIERWNTEVTRYSIVSYTAIGEKTKLRVREKEEKI